MQLPSGFAEVPCARCGTFVKGIQIGELCPDCRRQRVLRASRYARIISLAVTASFALYVVTRTPLSRTGRLWLAAGAIIIYFVTRKVAYGALMRHLPG
ncbi:MAG TPA: hypothetical protein VFO96_03960 [Gemmatimonadales bacterium]|nr:hypothetical protein [Gemmatimonadales bacterium]